MDRETLMAQVKSYYAQQGVNGPDGRPRHFYEGLSRQVVSAIAAGRFDNFDSGQSIVQAVARQQSDWLDRPASYY